MLNNMPGSIPELILQWQQQLLLQSQEREQNQEESTQSVHGVSWLSEPKVDPKGLPPETGAWTCPRCRSHRCIRTNPGDVQDATFRCAVCGYAFHGASAARLQGPEK